MNCNVDVPSLGTSVCVFLWRIVNNNCYKNDDLMKMMQLSTQARLSLGAIQYIKQNITCFDMIYTEVH
jgi:hypothetical protein